MKWDVTETEDGLTVLAVQGLYHFWENLTTKGCQIRVDFSENSNCKCLKLIHSVNLRVTPASNPSTLAFCRYMTTRMPEKMHYPVAKGPKCPNQMQPADMIWTSSTCHPVMTVCLSCIVSVHLSLSYSSSLTPLSCETCDWLWQKIENTCPC